MSNTTTFVDAFGNTEDGYGFRRSNGGTNLTYFPSIKFINLKLDFQHCLKAHLNPNTTLLILTTTTCDIEMKTICVKQQYTPSACNRTTPLNQFDILFDPVLKYKLKVSKEKLFNNFQNMFQRLNRTAAFKGFFTNLWYSSLPCVDVNGTVSFRDLDRR